MKNISRLLVERIEEEWHSGKIILVLGPRQVGKTTLIQTICEAKGDFIFINGDDAEDRLVLESAGEEKLRLIMGEYKTLFIDEAQRIPQIGLTLKIMHDRMPNIQVIVSGSSALERADELNEPLTGRKWEHMLFPIAWQELINDKSYKEVLKNLNQYLVFGMYPEVVINPIKAEKILTALSNSYLYKDLLQFQKIRKPEILDKLLFALAMQLGSEVNYNELSILLRIDRNTVEQYISLLEKAFVIFRIQPFSRNLRKEISSNRKIYFYDNGIRNAIIRNFSDVKMRNDMGALWENFLISEKMKINQYSERNAKTYYWRTYDQQEIDYIEEKNGVLKAYEFKWNETAKASIPKIFINTYAPEDKLIISPKNIENFLIPIK